MGKFEDLSYLKTLSIEIGTRCNLSRCHNKCPAQYMKRSEMEAMTEEQIISIMDQAIALNFQGYFAFHFYNEPLLYIAEIAKLKEKRSDYKFLLWSNGTLIKKVLEAGYSFDIFDKIVFTRYSESEEEMMSWLKSEHNSVDIYDAEMDDRLTFYESQEENHFTCKKIYIEMPIDFCGNIYICTFDWKGEYILGNLKREKLVDILKSNQYQSLLSENRGRLRHNSVVELCNKCPRPCLKETVIV